MYSNRKSNNFDLLRLIFAITVAIVHLAVLTKIEVLNKLLWFLSSEVSVDSFFVISGFLIFKSFDSSSSLKNYASKRIRRIFPGYSAVVVLCAFFMFFVSTKGAAEYFTIDFLKYIFFNLLTLNFIQPTLPGVFNTNSLPIINGALWTIKIEARLEVG